MERRDYLKTTIAALVPIAVGVLIQQVLTTVQAEKKIPQNEVISRLK